MMLQEQLWQQSPLGQQVLSLPVMSASLAFVGNMELKLPRPSASEDCKQQKENQVTFNILLLEIVSYLGAQEKALER